MLSGVEIFKFFVSDHLNINFFCEIFKFRENTNENKFREIS